MPNEVRNNAMKNIFRLIIGISLVGGLVACEEVIYWPVEGRIEGIVTDNNGAPLEGVQVTAVFESPSPDGQAFETIKSTTTTADGKYHLAKLWDNLILKTDREGFLPASVLVTLTKNNQHPIHDFSLQGSPTITRVALSQELLSAAGPDTVTVNLEVKDTYNSLPESYECNVLLSGTDGGTFTILNAPLGYQGLETFLFRTDITSDMLPVGNYAIAAEVRDPDGNEHRREVGTITVE